MVQIVTTRYLDRVAPGLMLSPAQERETESGFIPYALQTLTLTFGGTDPAVVGDYVVAVPLPSGGTYSFTFTSAGATLANTGPLFAAAWNSDPVLGRLYFASSSSAVVTILAKSANISIPAASFSITVPGATTLAAAQTVASGAASLRMGVLYQAASPNALTQAITGNFRSDVIAAALTDGMAIADVRGMVAREANSTQMAADFSNTTPDQYLSAQNFPGLLRGFGAFVVDPASVAITPSTSAVYAVLPSGTGSIVGALTTVSTNNLQVNVGGFLRVVDPSGVEIPVFQTPSTSLVVCKINRTN